MAFFLGLTAVSRLRSRVTQEATTLGGVRWLQMQSASDLDLRSQLQELIPEQQDRLKKLKSEHGKVQLGNITMDVVLGGMRGMIGMLWETSLLDPEEVSNLHAVVKVLELALKKQKPPLIVAEDVESEALGTLIINKLRAGIKVCAVKAPGFGENRKANLQDLAILTGGEVITEELGMNLENFEPQMLGTCKKVTVSKDDTVILDGAGDKKAIEERAERLRSAIEQSTSDYDKEKLQERLAKLSGGVAVLKIGGVSETEVGEKKDRVTDALNATKAAVEEGIVPGGGVALLYASKDLDKLQTANFDQKIGVQIIQNALKTPVHTIASNAGVEGAVIVGKLLEQDNSDLGYDAAKGEYVDMVKAGIIDPLKVIRTALVDAASVSSLMTTTESIIVEIPKEEKAEPAMGGMDF